MTENTQPRLLHIFSTFKVAGPQIRFCECANYFGDQFSHLIVAMDNHYEALERIQAGVPVQKVEMTCYKSQTLKNLWLFRKKMSEIKPDLLLTYNWGAIEWVMANAVFPVCPMIHAEDGFNEDEIFNQKARRVWMRRAVFPVVHRIVVPSTTLLRIAYSVWKQPHERLLCIPNGIDLERFSPREQVCLEQNEWVTIGTTAKLRAVKNLRRLIRVFKRIPPDLKVRLSIVGDGPDLMDLQSESQGNERIIFHGYQSDPAALVSKMDIFAVSSDTEQMPLAVIEAMALKKPIVSTDVGDIKYMLAQENKPFVVDVNDETAYLGKLLNLIKDCNLRKLLGYANFNKCHQTFGKNSMFNAYERLYLDALKRREKFSSSRFQ